MSFIQCSFFICVEFYRFSFFIPSLTEFFIFQKAIIVHPLYVLKSLNSQIFVHILRFNYRNTELFILDTETEKALLYMGEIYIKGDSVQHMYIKIPIKSIYRSSEGVWNSLMQNANFKSPNLLLKFYYVIS